MPVEKSTYKNDPMLRVVYVVRWDSHTMRRRSTTCDIIRLCLAFALVLSIGVAVAAKGGDDDGDGDGDGDGEGTSPVGGDKLSGGISPEDFLAMVSKQDQTGGGTLEQAEAADSNDVGSGEPPCPKTCPKLESPLCGSDGKTYANTCELQARNCREAEHGDPAVTVMHLGPCILNAQTKDNKGV